MAENKLGNINNKAQKPELMAPVGSYESLMAAVQGGAGSVYFGIEQLNMRARSSNNFSTADLKKIVKIARKHGLNTYITVNTVVYDAEISLMNQIIDTAKEAGVTAVIATDMATVQYASKQGVEVHASTQLNISNLEAVRFFARYCDVLVLARELTLKQIKNITDTIEAEHITGPSGKKVRIEIFIHGALCMSISGKCYLSLHEQNFSANRGECLQTCRKAYTVTEKESGNQLEIDNEYIMSPKDLWTIHFLNKILDAGVKILKIEGRARSPEYVKTVSRCYREAIDAWYEGAYTEDKIQLWQEQLKTVFNRGFWDGYYLGQRLGEWSHRYGSRATKRRIYLGKGMNYFPKIGVAEFLMETGTLKTGDHVLITGPTTGVIETTVNELRVDLKNVDNTVKGEHFSMPVTSVVRRSDKLYKIVDADEIQQQ